jgi:hypothetical protein
LSHALGNVSYRDGSRAQTHRADRSFWGASARAGLRLLHADRGAGDGAQLRGCSTHGSSRGILQDRLANRHVCAGWNWFEDLLRRHAPGRQKHYRVIGAMGAVPFVTVQVSSYLIEKSKVRFIGNREFLRSDARSDGTFDFTLSATPSGTSLGPPGSGVPLQLDHDRAVRGRPGG